MFRLSSNTPEPANQALLVYYRCFRTSHSRWKDYAGRELRVCGSLTLTLMEQDALKDIVCTWKGPTLLQMTFWLTARYIETEDLLSVLQRVLALSVIREKLAQVSNLCVVWDAQFRSVSGQDVKTFVKLHLVFA